MPEITLAARICMNGHLRDFKRAVTIPGRPGLDRPIERGEQGFCKRCGDPLIIECPDCRELIDGDDIDYDGNPLPAFCADCGKPYPWTRRKIEVARERIELEQGLTQQQKDELKTDIEDIAHNRPRAGNAVIRAKAILSKAGGTAGPAIREIIVSVASDAMKRVLLGS
jgi:hypothetical protein